MRLHRLLLAAAVTVPTVAASQAVPTRTLAAPDAEWSEPFSQITGVRELRSGRVIVSDSRDKSLQLIDFKGTATKIGREGAGPGEYGLPMALYAAPGDSTWLWDALNGRFLVIDPNGKPVSTFMTADAQPLAPTPAPGGAQGRGAPNLRGGFGLGFAQGIDAQGRLYFRAPSVRFNGHDASIGDSTPVVRWDRRTKRVDTVGVLVNPPAPPVAAPPVSADGGVRVTVRLGGAGPFASADAMAVTPQGNVALVRARDYHVDWITNGRSVSGAPIRYDRVRVNDQDRKQWIEAQKNATGTMIVNDGNGRRVQNVPVGDGETPVFPEFKGPFRTVLAAPNGQIWVDRYMPFGSPPTYDVIDATGKLVQRVVLPQRSRVLGFGNGTVYVIRFDEDDLQYLRRYRL